ncbi:hypothetical protein [Paraburkholderia hospita]|uniref:hypothetical protein n=1 Tax=Paraburkholderia hospita TaxID=169430 RepID=UPI003ECE6608
MDKRTIDQLSSQAWAIHNIVRTLHVALPDDASDAAVPTRCLLLHVLGLTEQLAMELMDMDMKLPEANHI